MDEIDIGYMQVQLRIYSDGSLFETLAINAEDDCYVVETDKVTSHHQVIDDPANVYLKVFQIELTIPDTQSLIVLHMPLHQSEDWEVVKGTDVYTIGFYCILGKQGHELVSHVDD